MGSKSTALALPQLAAFSAPSQTLAQDGLWINSKVFGALAGIDERNSRAAMLRALNGNTWRGTHLQVRVVDGSGGRGGKAFQVYVPSIPPDLRATWHKHNPSALASPTVAPTQRPAPAAIDIGIGGRVAEMKWKLAIVSPALVHAKGSAARAAMLNQIAAREHPGLHGKPITIAVDTLRDWLLKIETGDEKRLARPRRADAGKSRYFINARWDKECPLPDAEKRPIAAAIGLHIRGLWRASTNSERKVNSLASAELQRLSQSAGWPDAPLIAPGLHLVRRYSPSRLIGIKEKDAKRFYDNYTPSIHRRRPDRPMDIVIGDVHPVDVLLRREDGTTATPRMIAWLDLATNDLFYTLVLLPPGKGVTQAHIVASFVDMVQAWGLPRTLYLDNGSEYLDPDMIAGFEKLQGLCEGFRVVISTAAEIDATTSPGEGAEDGAESPRAVVRSRPYNAKAKAIEGAFSCLEKFIALVPGYIGGNRMKKKTHNVGKAPAPFPGTFEDFRDGAFAEAVAFYRNEPQRGTMGGKSPNERKREAFAAGYQPPFSAPREACLFAFASVRRARVETGGIKIDNEWFWVDELIPEIGNMIEVRYAKWDGQFALWVTPNGKPVLIPKDTLWHPLDTAGAKEQGRRKGLQTANVNGLKAISPPVDTYAAMLLYNAAMPAAPETPAGPQITLEPDTRALVDAIREGVNASAVPPVRLPALNYQDNKTGEIVRPADLAPEPQAPRYDIYAAPPPQKTKPDASADAPGFDIYAAFVKTPPLNHHEKETEKR